MYVFAPVSRILSRLREDDHLSCSDVTVGVVCGSNHIAMEYDLASG